MLSRYAEDIKSTPPATVVTEMKAAGLTQVTTASVTVSASYQVNNTPQPPVDDDSAASTRSFFTAVITTFAVLVALL